MADEALLASLNQGIAAQRVRNQVGALVETVVEAVLVNESRTVAYAVRKNIPALLRDEAIPLDQVDVFEGESR